MVEVSRAKDGASLPGDCEHSPVVFWVHERDRVGNREGFKIKNQVRTAQRSNPSFPSKLPTKLVGPGTGRVDDRPGFQFERAEVRAGLIFHRHTAHLPVLGSEQSRCLGVI